MMTIAQFLRHAALALGLLLAMPLLNGPAAAAANPAEEYVGDNIHKGLDILNNKGLSVDQRRSPFEQFLLGLTDMKRIAVFTLGNYRRSASQIPATEKSVTTGLPPSVRTRKSTSSGAWPEWSLGSIRAVATIKSPGARSVEPVTFKVWPAYLAK